MKSVYYVINGRRYTFTKIYTEGGVVRGYCSKLKSWATLFGTYVHLDSGPVFIAPKMG